MKTKEKKEVFSKDIKELKNRLKEAREQLFEMRMDFSQNKLKNSRQLFFKRREIAQIMTVIREKELVK
ncbi:MAG: 50S ribosomal protein L29 [Candidatus Levybacteria bacterium]|nr:50S ribosomal protein L29 [Candidatus Levybacteria bacterium]MBI2420779.1 50S ribosomal protein L29 [Candidatus Levybacteria bacterium]